MDFTINRDKNYINFLANGKKKPYVFDINTGVLYSLQSKPLKNLPPKFRSCLDECSGKGNDMVLALMREIIELPHCFQNRWAFSLSMFTDCTNLLMVADKLNSLGYKYHNYTDVNRDNLITIEKNFKTFVKCYNEDNNLTISTFVEEYYPSIWAKEHNIEINEIFTISFVRYLLDKNYTDTQLKYIINTICRGGCYYYMDENGRFDSWCLLTKFNEYFEMCKALNINYEKDFFRGYINARRMYLVAKTEIDNKAIIDNYKGLNLFYEDENFTVVIPQSTEDFKNEATQQSNCVYSCYLKDVVQHKTNVVFIRKKDDITKSYITCEVSNSGQIRQYYLSHNRIVIAGTIEKEFYHKYATWLKENWV